MRPGSPRYFPPGFHWFPRPYLSYVFVVASGCHHQLGAPPDGSGPHRLPLKMPWGPVVQVHITDLVQGVSQRTPSTEFTTEFLGSPEHCKYLLRIKLWEGGRGAGSQDIFLPRIQSLCHQDPHPKLCPPGHCLSQDCRGSCTFLYKVANTENRTAPPPGIIVTTISHAADSDRLNRTSWARAQLEITEVLTAIAS